MHRCACMNFSSGTFDCCNTFVPLQLKEEIGPIGSGQKPKSIVDMIQEDFPRTPSPIYHVSE